MDVLRAMTYRERPALLDREAERRAAIERLRVWHAKRRWARVDPYRLEVTNVRTLGPLEITLRTEHEVRGVDYHIGPATPRQLAPPAIPDPWQSALDLPADAPVGASARLGGGDPIVLDCTRCSGNGDHRCNTCGGTGTRGGGETGSNVCGTCRGSGQVACSACRRLGGVLATPALWARIDAVEARRVTDEAALPTEVALDLADREMHGHVVWHREGAVLDPASLETADLDATCEKLVRDVLSDPGIPAGARIRRQVLVVHRVSVYELQRASGEPLYVWGDPPTVHPRRALATPLGRLLGFFWR